MGFPKEGVRVAMDPFPRRVTEALSWRPCRKVSGCYHRGCLDQGWWFADPPPAFVPRAYSPHRFARVGEISQLPPGLLDLKLLSAVVP